MSSWAKNSRSLSQLPVSFVSICLYLVFAVAKVFPQAGALDTSFNPPFTPLVNMDSRALAELPDGSILVGLTHFNFAIRSNEVYLARLNPDGSPRSLVVPFPGMFTNTGRGVWVLEALADGKVLVGGMFSLGTNGGLSTLTRLDSDGLWDNSFNHARIDGRLWCLAVQSDGKVLLGGQFSHVHGAPRTNIARLNADGSLDSSFDPAAMGRLSHFSTPRVNGIAVQPDNKILIAGDFGSVNGVPRWNIARLNANGSHDESFDPPSMFGHDGLGQSAQSVTVDQSGRILVCGQFGRFDNEPRIHVARLFENGSLDPTLFAPIGPESVVVHRTVVEPGGKIVLAGGFTTTGAVVRAHVVRLNTNGSVDASFDAGTIEGSVSRLIQLRDGKYLLGGQPTAVNGVPRFFAARLMGDDTGGAGKIQFLTDSFPAAEDGLKPTQLLVTRTDGRTGGISVDFSTMAGTASAMDFHLTNGSIQFAPGEFTPKAIHIAIVDDPRKESTEEFTVVLQNPQGGAVLGQPGAATVTIRSNDYAGSVDTSFAPGTAVRGPVNFSMVSALLLQPDGRLLVGGRFTPDDGTNNRYLTRLNRDGSVDSAFVPGTGPSSEVTALAAQPDGRILVGGEFTTFNGTNANGLVRLETNGTIDPGFSAGSGPDGPILAMAVEPGGSILIGGEFYSVDGVNRTGLARLNSTGTLQPLDVQLAGRSYAYVKTITLLTNGGAYVGGLFDRAGGFPRNGLFRLLPNGSVDPNFQAATVTNQFDLDGDYTFYVYCVGPLADGKILVGGDFYEVDGEMRHGIVRLNGDGSLDRAFVPEFDDQSYIVAIARLPDGSLYLGGSFDLPTLPYWVDGVIRLHTNGRIDWSFEPALIDGFVNAMVMQPDGQIIFAGHFDECATTVRHNLARLNMETVPALSIERSADGKVRVSWPEALGDLGLEGAGALNDGAWTPAPPPVLSNGRYSSTNSTTDLRRFFRARN